MLMTKNNNQHCECKAPVTMLILPKVASQSQTTHAQKHKQNMQWKDRGKRWTTSCPVGSKVIFGMLLRCWFSILFGSFLHPKESAYCTCGRPSQSWDWFQAYLDLPNITRYIILILDPCLATYFKSAGATSEDAAPQARKAPCWVEHSKSPNSWLKRFVSLEACLCECERLEDPLISCSCATVDGSEIRRTSWGW